MTTYCVNKDHPSASNSNAGTSASLPWLTLAKATATVAAGDTVHIAGFYRETMTLATSGSSGSPIIWNFDVKGEYVGSAYAGMHGITAHDSDNAAATRASCLNVNEKTFNEIYNCIFLGGTTAPIIDTGSSNKAMEGVIIQSCVVQASTTTYAIKVDVNAGVVPTTSGLKLLGNVIMGGVDIDWDGNATANNNIKWTIDGNYINSLSNGHGIQMDRVGSNTYSISGIAITNNTIQAPSYPIGGGNFTDTTNPIRIYRNLLIGGSTSGIYFPSGTNSSAVGGSNVMVGSASFSNTTYIDDGTSISRVSMLLGGIHDLPAARAFGYSPFRSMEPFSISGYTSNLIDTGALSYIQTLDYYGNPRRMGRRVDPVSYYYFNASTDAVSDPNGAWGGDSGIVTQGTSSFAYTSSTGNTTTNYIFAGGTTAPTSGGTINKVEVRFHSGLFTGSAAVAEIKFYTDNLGELLGTHNKTVTGDAWSTWLELSTPTGGWTWQKVHDLEFKAYSVAGGGGGWLAIHEIDVSVSVVADGCAPDIGAVEANSRPAKNASDVFGDGNSSEFSGAGYKDFFQPVTAGAHTITFKARYDSNYIGTKPTLEVRNIVGDTNKSDTMTEAANTTETLSCTFTATADCWVWVRIASLDTSTNGKCFFDTGTYA